MSKSGKSTSKKKDPIQEQETAEVENSGNYLRTLRMSKGLSIKDVTEATRISETNLNAMEDMDFAALPANTFTRGLLNIYANFLGADAESIVTQFMVAREESSTQKRRSRPIYSRKILTPKHLAEPAQISSMAMAGILLLFIVVSFTGYCLYTSWNPFSILVKENREMHSIMQNVFPEEKHISGTPSGEEIIIVPAEPSPGAPPSLSIQESENTPSVLLSGEPALAQKTNPQQTKYNVTINFLQDTSVELTMDSGEKLVKEFKAGDLQSWSAASSITMTFATPDSAEIQVNSVPVAFPRTQDGHYTLHIPQDVTELQQNE